MSREMRISRAAASALFRSAVSLRFGAAVVGGSLGHFVPLLDAGVLLRRRAFVERRVERDSLVGRLLVARRFLQLVEFAGHQLF